MTRVPKREDKPTLDKLDLKYDEGAGRFFIEALAYSRKPDPSVPNEAKWIQEKDPNKIGFTLTPDQEWFKQDLADIRKKIPAVDKLVAAANKSIVGENGLKPWAVVYFVGTKTTQAYYVPQEYVEGEDDRASNLSYGQIDGKAKPSLKLSVPSPAGSYDLMVSKNHMTLYPAKGKLIEFHQKGPQTNLVQATLHGNADAIERALDTKPAPDLADVKMHIAASFRSTEGMTYRNIARGLARLQKEIEPIFMERTK